MKKQVGIFVLVVGLTLLVSSLQAQQLTILHTNDQHGHFMAFDIIGQKDVGGFACRMTVIKRVRQEMQKKGGYVLLLDGGDVNTGEPASDILHAKPDLELMQRAGYAAMAIGNHEFDHDLSVLRQQQSWVNFPFLCANLVTRASGKLLFKDYIIKQYGQLRVMILGLTTDETPYISTYGRSKQLLFQDPLATARAQVPVIKQKEKADYVIVLSHLGHERDQLLARACPQIDLIVGGHSHKFLTQPLQEGHTLIVQAGAKGLAIGRLDLFFTKGHVQKWHYALMALNLKKDLIVQGEVICKPWHEQFPLDPETLALTQKYFEQVKPLLLEPVGYLTADITVDPLGTPPCSTAAGNLVTNAIRERVKTDIAFQNVGGIRSAFRKGPVCLRDIRRALPFANTVVVYRVSGKQLMDILRCSAVRPAEDSGFLEVAGLTYQIRDGQPFNVHVNGQPLELNKSYTIATNSFLAKGGDRYQVFTTLTGKTDTGYLLSDCLRHYFKIHSHISPDTTLRVSQTIATKK